MVDRIERNKDLIQELVESTANHVGQIATIITGAVAGAAREVGEIFTDGFEMREAARKAKLDEERDVIDAAIVDEIESDEHGAHESAPADTPDEADALPGAGVFTAPAAVEAAEAGESRD